MRILALIMVFGLMGCGYQDPKVVEIEKEVPVPVPGPGQGGTAGTTWGEMRQLFQKNCSRCHGNDRFGQSETEMRDPKNRVESQIRTGRMPPNQNGFNDRAKMLNFF